MNDSSQGGHHFNLGLAHKTHSLKHCRLYTPNAIDQPPNTDGL